MIGEDQGGQGDTLEIVDEPAAAGTPKPRRPRHIGRLIANVVAVAAAAAVIVALVNAVNASAVPPTSDELMAAVRVTPEDVSEIVVSLDEQRAILEAEGGSVRQQAMSLMALSGAADSLSAACLVLTRPSLPDGAAWSTRAVWLSTAEPLEIALINGAHVLADPGEAADRFDVIKALSNDCAGEVAVRLDTSDSKIQRLSVTGPGSDSRTRLVYTLLGNVIFVSGVLSVGTGDAAASAKILTEALDRQADRVDEFGAAQFEALLEAEES